MRGAARRAWRNLLERIPADPSPTEALLFALGAGTLLGVAAAILGEILGLVGLGFQPSGDTLPLLVAAFALVFVLGGRATRAVAAAAVVTLIDVVAVVLHRMLTIAITGRAPGDPRLATDAFAAVPETLGTLAGALVLGAGLGAILRTLLPAEPRAPRASPIVRAAGAAFIAGTIANLIWPAQPIASLISRTNYLAIALVALPLIIAGPLVGGAYAARRGAALSGIALLALYLTLPPLISTFLRTPVDLNRLGDPRFVAIAGQIRTTVAVDWLLVLVRFAAWPLAAAFVLGFLTPPRPAPTLSQN